MSIMNLTRAILPKISRFTKENTANIASMPEMILSKLMRTTKAKSIIHVGMNECKSARILPKKVNTIYTDGLASCNSVGIIAKSKDGSPIAILSHYMPSANSQNYHAQAIEKELQSYGDYFDSSTKPKVFYNVPGYQDEGILKPCVNLIFDKIRPVLNKFFKGGIEEQTILYQTKNRPAFFSSANIFQFDTKNSSKCKITAVGEKEFFIDLNK